MSVKISTAFHKFHGAVHPILDVRSSFELTASNINVISTPSGWGKTTLFRLMSGWFELGQNTSFDSNYDINSDVFFIGNHQTLLPWKTVEQNLRIYAGEEVSERILTALLKRLDLEVSTLRKFPYQLSLGMYKRVELVCAKIAQKRLIILDEFFASLDSHSRELARDLILENQEGIYLLSSHHPEDLPFDSIAHFSLIRDEVTGTISRVRQC